MLVQMVMLINKHQSSIIKWVDAPGPTPVTPTLHCRYRGQPRHVLPLGAH
jgi:hypothetical protein